MSSDPNQITARLPRRIDSVVSKRGGFFKRAADRRLEMVKLFCSGMCLKKIGAKFDTRADNVSYAINAHMREVGVKTHAELGVWAARQGLV